MTMPKPHVDKAIDSTNRWQSSFSSDAERLAYDSGHIWHPYASAVSPMLPFLVDSAQGVYLQLADGRRLIDGMSSWWSVIHGYNHPILNEAVRQQLDSMAHVMFGGLTHRPAIELAHALIAMTPAGLEHVFYCDSGSVAVEVAMKMALQYQQAKGNTQKTTLATCRGGYHGDTWHTMSVCDPENGMHHVFQGRLSPQHFVPKPQSTFDKPFEQADLTAVEQLFLDKGNEIAAFIIEPIVQGAGGMYFYHPDYLRGLADLCKAHDILLIADEIATGFGRTGRLFACEWAAVSPDILCLGKALTGGYMSFAATLCHHEVAAVISAGEPGVFMHGPTFMANPLACSVALASVNLIQTGQWQSQIALIESTLQTVLLPLEQLACVATTRVLGGIGVIELHQAVDMTVIQPALVEQGVWVRPFGKLVYIMPPYVISRAELEQLVGGIEAVLKQLY